jgi:bifunctional UDP-N-acetylglucosamine pyrophosphorylase/glucosamine-1-phosphate N-acetyltransferase
MADPLSVLGANTMAELAEAERLLRARINLHWMKEGVRLTDPAATYIGSHVQFGRGVAVGPGTVIEGVSLIGNDVTIGAHCVLKDVVIADGAVIKHGVVAEKADIGARVNVGPMAHFRPGTKVAEDAKVGNFVEVKASTIGAKSAVSHLSYIGDADIGKRVNVGCGFVTCNYDGKAKHKSVIGDDVFIGSDSQVVAPIEIAAGTYIGSGSTVTDSVPEKDSLVIARTRQVTKPGYAKRYKK